MDTMLQDIPRVASYLNDTIIMGTDKVDFQKTLDQVLACIAEYRFHLQAKKCDLYMQQGDTLVS